MTRHAPTRAFGGLRLLLLGVLMASLVVTLRSNATRVDADDADNEKTLLIWAGDQAHQAPDFVAVVDFDPDSPTYGGVLRTVPLPRFLGAGAVGNEPHHVGLSAD